MTCHLCACGTEICYNCAKDTTVSCSGCDHEYIVDKLTGKLIKITPLEEFNLDKRDLSKEKHQMTTIEIPQTDFNTEVMKALKNREDVLVRHGLHSTILVVGKCDDDNEFIKLRISAAFKIIDSGE